MSKNKVSANPAVTRFKWLGFAFRPPAGRDPHAVRDSRSLSLKSIRIELKTFGSIHRKTTTAKEK